MKSAAKAKQTKRGRKGSGLKDLSPEAARYVISGWSLSAVREAVALQGRAQALGPHGQAPTLERALKGDLGFAVALESEYSHLRPRVVLKAQTVRDQLISADVDVDYADVAEGFLADVAGAQIGKLTASYGEGLGGGTSAEPERFVIAVDRLARAQAKLSAKQRAALWGVLVFNLSLADVGYAVAGEKETFACSPHKLRAAGSLLLEGALHAMLPLYRDRIERNSP
jgi:hypothetical protein